MPADDEDYAKFVADEGGDGFDHSKIRGRRLTDEQARTIAMQNLADGTRDLSASVLELAQALKKRSL